MMSPTTTKGDATPATVRSAIDNLKPVVKQLDKLVPSGTDTFHTPIYGPVTFGHIAWYAAFDDYSPIALEEQGLDKSFRAKFEDLVRTENNEKMLDKREIRESSRQAPHDWVSRFLVQRTAPDAAHEATMTGVATAKQNLREIASPLGLNVDTELDMYEHFLSNLSKSQATAPQKKAKRNSRAVEQPVSVEKSSQIWTESDGTEVSSITTTMTYANGRVKNITDTTRTAAQRPEEPRAGGPQASTNYPAKVPETPQQEKKNGWFWS